MACYETVVVVDPLAPEGTFEKHVGKVKEQIEAREGRILKTEEWGKRKLAYSIKDRRDGMYFLVEFEAQGDVVAALDQYYRLQESILRYMTIVRDAPSPEGAVSPVAMDRAQAEIAGPLSVEEDEGPGDDREDTLDDQPPGSDTTPDVV